METKIKQTNKKLIPIFFATDDNYIPYLEVALRSLMENASKKFNYNIHILNTGLNPNNKSIIESLSNDIFNIIFDDISDRVDPIKLRLKNVYHFSLVTYYRLFIESLFPQYDKVLYLDCDIVVLGDISKLYNVNLGNNLLGAINEQIIASNETLRKYASFGIGVSPDKYFNAGILVMNLKRFRSEQIEEKFVYLMNTYNFDIVDPDQAYLNALCSGQIKLLPNGWNKEPLNIPLEGKLNIVHYALYKKPWQYDDVPNGEYFWHYAKQCKMYNQIIANKNSFDDAKKKQKEQANIEIIEHALRIVNSKDNIYHVLFEGDYAMEQMFRDFFNVEFEEQFEKVEI